MSVQSYCEGLTKKTMFDPFLLLDRISLFFLLCFQMAVSKADATSMEELLDMIDREGLLYSFHFGRHGFLLNEPSVEQWALIVLQPCLFFFFCQYIFYKDGQIANRS